MQVKRNRERKFCSETVRGGGEGFQASSGWEVPSGPWEAALQREAVPRIRGQGLTLAGGGLGMCAVAMIRGGVDESAMRA